MLKTILAISGKPGLFKLVSQGKNMLIVESLIDGKRLPVYAHDKVISLGDIAIYTVEDDVPLTNVFEAIKSKNDGKVVDLNSFADNADLRKYFLEILPEFDEDRVHTSDIKKVFAWYNMLVNAGITDFIDKEEEAAASEETAAE
jgi:hypothetical protein